MKTAAYRKYLFAGAY